MGSGATVGVLGTGVPRLACLRPAAWLKGGPAQPIFINTKLKTLTRGQASWGGRQGASSGTASSGWLMRRRRVQGGVPREVPMMQAMTTKGARRAPARAVSSLPLWCKQSKRMREHQAKASISVQQDQDQSNGRMEVTVEPKSASPPEPLTGRTNFSQDKCTRCSPSNWPIVGALPAQYLGRGPGPLPINRTSHHKIGQENPHQETNRESD